MEWQRLRRSGGFGAPLTHIAAGDLATGRRYALLRQRPIFREEGLLRNDWLLVSAAMAGDLDHAVEVADSFRLAWERTGRLPLGGFAMAPLAAALAHGLRGDHEARRDWLGVFEYLNQVVGHLEGRRMGVAPLFEAIVALHHGDHGHAHAVLADDPGSRNHWLTGAWRQWYAAVGAETSVLADDAGAAERITIARATTTGNPWPPPSSTAPTGSAPTTLPCCSTPPPSTPPAPATNTPRTLVLAGGDHTARGQELLTSLGAAPMPPRP